STSFMYASSGSSSSSLAASPSSAFVETDESLMRRDCRERVEEALSSSSTRENLVDFPLKLIVAFLLPMPSNGFLRGCSTTGGCSLVGSFKVVVASIVFVATQSNHITLSKKQ